MSSSVFFSHFRGASFWSMGEVVAKKRPTPIPIPFWPYLSYEECHPKFNLYMNSKLPRLLSRGRKCRQSRGKTQARAQLSLSRELEWTKKGGNAPEFVLGNFQNQQHKIFPGPGIVFRRWLHFVLTPVMGNSSFERD